jgi:hypothetical protein
MNMKFPTRFILFVIFAVSLASCHTLSVQKRLYQPGYSIDWKHKQRHQPATAPSKEQLSFSLAKQKNDSKAEELKPDAEANDLAITQPMTAAATTATASQKSSVNRRSQKETIKSTRMSADHGHRGFVSPVPKVRELVQANLSLGSDGDSTGIGSVLWFIIVLLIVLWLLGLLVADLGGIIYLLLVLALILLVFRLLGVL